VLERARVVVIGAGVGGASIAHHLAEAGCPDVLVIDRAEPTSGSTFHSAGLVGQLRSSLPLTRMMMHSVELYRRLEAEAAETGRSPGWREVGSLRLAATPERLDELRRQNGWAKTFGLPMELLSPREAHDLFPLMDPAGVLGAAWLPTDGYLDPSGLTYALLGAARARGVTVETGVRVTDLVVDHRRHDGRGGRGGQGSRGGRDGQGNQGSRGGRGDRRPRVTGVVTDHGTVEAETVVAACGMYTPQVAALAGPEVQVPIVPMAHQYLITRAIDGVTPGLPQLRDPDNLVYFRPEGTGLVLGGYERDPAPWAVDGVPDDFNNRLLPEDWDRFAPLMALACKRVPAAEDADIVELVNGPEGFTPDNEFVLGESAVAGFFVAAGFCAHGIAGAGGVGRVMAEWILDGEPSFDTWKMDIRRFGPQYRSRDHAVARTVEVYATYYDIHYPNEERRAGRPLRRSPAYPALERLGCVFGEKSGWERPNWFAPNAAAAPGEGGERLRPRGWAGRHWSPAIEAEALACRDTAALFDETSFSKLEVAGPGAARFLNRICANDVDRAVGTVTYTQLLNDRGGVECDLTATRLAADRYLLITGTAFGAHDLGWIHKQQAAQPEGDGCTARDVTAAWCCLGLWGPAARALLQPLTRTPLADEAFPYLTAQQVSVGAVPVLAVRVTFVGELGWELYCPTEYGATLWDLLWSAGEDHGLVAGGYRAIDALRIEKGYRVWGVDVTPEDDPYAAGLGFAVRLDKPGGFVGRDALVALRERGPQRRLRCLVLDDPRAVPLGSEPVRVDATIVGRVTSGNQGYRVGAAIAFAYLPSDRAELGRRVEVEVFGDWIGAEVVRDPVYDPAGARIRS
jgi:glycine cleavage system aminomethyltransferase T/glycine/D-amino acid oxidase-like deaminating enzyme